MGTRLGYVGQSGANASSDHLHYEQLIDANGDGHLQWGVTGGEDVAAVFNGVTYTGSGGEWRNVVSRNSCGTTPPPPSTTKYWVDTFANASVYGSPTSTTATGTLNTGTDYVCCKVWGRNVSDASGNYNHYWLQDRPRHRARQPVRLGLLPLPLGQRPSQGQQRRGHPRLLSSVIDGPPG
jgi:hypothetical protein